MITYSYNLYELSYLPVSEFLRGQTTLSISPLPQRVIACLR
jgi:hypothetical protein